LKLPLLVLVLVLSVHGWCASVIPSQRIARAITPSHQAIENGKLQETGRPIRLDKMKAVMMGWGLITYLTAIIWWAITAKNSLDKILRDVLQGMEQYP